MQPPFKTIGQVIQWALNAQTDLLQAYTATWGFAAKIDIWENYTALLKVELPSMIDLDFISGTTLKVLVTFLCDPTQNYHLEMSTDEMATLFLNYVEKT